MLDSLNLLVMLMSQGISDVLGLVFWRSFLLDSVNDYFYPDFTNTDHQRTLSCFRILKIILCGNFFNFLPVNIKGLCFST